MKKKKSVTWFGVSHVTEDLKLRTVEIQKETATRIYLAEESQKGWEQCTVFHNKVGTYENWYRTKDDAVKAKLKWLRKNVRESKEQAALAKKNLAEFESDHA
jgi:hypothetical protein